MEITIINGPNLNLLGKREPSIYGKEDFETYFEGLRTRFAELNLHYYQSNSEGELIDRLHAIGFSHDGILLNAGAYTHTSVALGDAIAAIETPVIEIHISNIHQREAFRHKSMIGRACKGAIVGLGLESYALGVYHFSQNLPTT